MGGVSGKIKNVLQVLEGTLDTKGPYGKPIIQKVRFESTSKDHFTWSAHWSYDEGKTWLENTGYCNCSRIR